jgi:hypothetical protein
MRGHSSRGILLLPTPPDFPAVAVLPSVCSVLSDIAGPKIRNVAAPTIDPPLLQWRQRDLLLVAGTESIPGGVGNLVKRLLYHEIKCFF